METKLKEFIIHWKDKTTDVFKGKDIADAFTRAGYGAGAVRAVDYYEEVKKEG